MVKITRTEAAPAIPTPVVDTEEPVAVIPAASVAPLDGDADGERINTFIVARKERGNLGALAGNTMAEVRGRVTRKPFTYLTAAFALGYLIARATR